MRSPAGRITNQKLLVALVLVFGTGVATVAIGSSSGRWAAIAHGIAGLVILLLVPWKSRVVRGGLRRGRGTRWVSLLLAVLVVVTFVAGLGYATGLVRSIAGRPGLWVHIAVALVLVPLVLWHVVARRIRPALHRVVRDRLLRSGRHAHHELARGPDPGRRPGSVAANRRGWRRPVPAGAGRALGVRCPDTGDPGLHVRLVLPAGLERRAGQRR